jgi:DNA-binding MarR family transcriptional regulator
MISREVETRALEYLAEDEFCSPFEIATVIELWDADSQGTVALIGRWEECGWVELLPQDELELPPLVHLTEAGFAEVERRRAAS